MRRVIVESPFAGDVETNLTYGRACSIYVLSPPENILRERLVGRGDSPETIERRLQDCKSWDERALKDNHLYECFINNNGLIEDTVQEVIKFINCNRA